MVGKQRPAVRLLKLIGRELTAGKTTKSGKRKQLLDRILELVTVLDEKWFLKIDLIFLSRNAIKIHCRIYNLTP